MNQPRKKSLFFKKFQYGRSDDEEEKKSSRDKKEENCNSSESSASVDFKNEIDEIQENCIDPETNNKPNEILGPRYLR
jgi:hypothetical protein